MWAIFTLGLQCIALGLFRLSNAECGQRGAQRELGVGRQPELGNRLWRHPESVLDSVSDLLCDLVRSVVLFPSPLEVFLSPLFLVKFLDPWVDLIQNQVVVVDKVMKTFCPRATSDFSSSFIEKLLLNVLNGKDCQCLHTEFSKF